MSRFGLVSLEGAGDLATLRRRLLDNVLFLIALAATPGVALSVLRAVDIGWQSFMSAQVAVLLVVWGLHLGRAQVPFGLRLSVLAGVMSAVAFFSTLQLGPVADARVLLVFVTLLVGLLVGARAAFAYVALIVLGMALLGGYAVRNGLELAIDYPRYVRLPSAWASIAYALGVYGGVIAYVAASLVSHLQHNADVLSRTSEAARIGTWECASDFTRMAWSPVVKSIYGISEEPAGLPAWLAFCADDDTRHQMEAALRNTLRDGQPFDLELPIHNAAGEMRWLRVTGLGLADAGGHRSLSGLVQDISGRKQADQLKSEFVSAVSHELRTPLTAISGALALVVSGRMGELPGPVAELLDMASRNGERLRALIADLLDIERLAAGALPLDITVQPLLPLVEQAVAANRSYGSTRGVQLHLLSAGDAVKVAVDASRLQQVLANFLSNAIKFSPDKGVVELRVERIGERVRTSVRDYGPGIPESFRSRVFQKFSQADGSDSRQRGGTGLGLAITRELVERMGGSVGFDSVPGQGATFYFDLPVHPG